jgi:transcriptional regulator with XRE-family HTH domain
MSYVLHARTSLGLSQKGFAEKLGVNQSTVSRWEADEASMPTTARMAIAAVVAAGATPVNAASGDAAADREDAA